MPNILLRPKGYLSSGFSNHESYRENPHTGIDFVYGFKKPCYALADGTIYKLMGDKSTNLMEYKNVYQICDTPVGLLEIAYVHCWDFLVDEQDFVLQGQPIYLEGNTGKSVFVGGKIVEVDEKWSGKGSHSHISVRPVEKTKESKGHFLNDAKGKRYKDSDGFFYRIVWDNDVFKGWVDYSKWTYTPTDQQLLMQLSKVLGYVKHQMK